MSTRNEAEGTNAEQEQRVVQGTKAGEEQIDCVTLPRIIETHDPAFVREVRKSLGLYTARDPGDTFLCTGPIHISPYVDRYGLAGYVIAIDSDRIVLVLDFDTQEIVVVSPKRRRWNSSRRWEDWQMVRMFLWGFGLKTDTPPAPLPPPPPGSAWPAVGGRSTDSCTGAGESKNSGEERA